MSGYKGITWIDCECDPTWSGRLEEGVGVDEIDLIGPKEQVKFRVFDVSDLDLEDVPHRLGLIKATWTGVRVLPREVRTNTLLRAGNHP